MLIVCHFASWREYFRCICCRQFRKKLKRWGRWMWGWCDVLNGVMVQTLYIRDHKTKLSCCLSQRQFITQDCKTWTPHRQEIRAQTQKALFKKMFLNQKPCCVLKKNELPQHSPCLEYGRVTGGHRVQVTVSSGGHRGAEAKHQSLAIAKAPWKLSGEKIQDF